MKTDLEDDLHKLIEDFPHPKLIMGEYEIIIEGMDDYDEHYELYKDSKFIQSFEIPQNIIDYFEEEGIDLESMNYEIE